MCTEDVPTPWAGSRRPAGARHPAGKHVSIAARRRHAHQRGPRGGCHPRPCSLLQALSPTQASPQKGRGTCAATACRSAKPCTGCTTGLPLLCFALPNMLCLLLMRVGVLQSRQAPIALLQPAHPHIVAAIRLGPHNPRRNSQAPSQVQKHHTAMDTVVTPLKEFGKNSVRLVKRCTKPDRRGAHGPTGSC